MVDSGGAGRVGVGAEQYEQVVGGGLRRFGHDASHVFGHAVIPGTWPGPLPATMSLRTTSGRRRVTA